MSILLQYKRLFAIKPMRLACTIMLAFLGTWGAIGTVVTAFICIPLSKFWNISQPGVCMNKEVPWFLSAGLQILTDIIILILPMPVLHSLQLPRRQKYALMVVFALGGL
jgi:hypothetical protein